MRYQLGRLRAQANQFVKKGEHYPAIRLYVAVLRRAPEDYEARMGLADVLAIIGATTEAAGVYEATARLCINGGRPLLAVVAMRAMQTLGRSPDALLTRLSSLYGRGSNRLANVGARLNTCNDEFEVPAKEFRRECSVKELVEEAERIGSELDGVGELPLKFSHIPLLSELSPVRLVQLVRAMRVRRIAAWKVLFNRGDPGQSCFLLARGKVRVVGQGADGREEVLATLSDGAVFGEMSLITGQPRSATIQATEDTALLELGPEALAAIGDELHRVAPLLDKLAHRRWMSNVLRHNPVFSVFDEQERAELLRRFSALEVPAGTMLFAQDEAVRGVYLVVRGEVGLFRRGSPDSAPQLLERMGPGTLPGLEALVNG
jgi:CRP-like cAMP-binding protein